jgi:hypothetical protein
LNANNSSDLSGTLLNALKETAIDYNVKVQGDLPEIYFSGLIRVLQK